MERMKRQLIPFKELIISSILETRVRGRPMQQKAALLRLFPPGLIALAMQRHQA